MSVRGEKIKILFAVGRFSVGGAEKLLVHHLAALDKETFDPSVITIFDEQKDTFADRIYIDRCFHFRSTFDMGSFCRLYSYLRKERFEVVVTHLFTANLLVRLAAVLARVPIVIAFEHNVYPNKRRWQILMDRFLARRTDRIITSSEVTKKFTAAQEKIPLGKFQTMYIPPLLDRRPPQDLTLVRKELGIEAEVPVVLTVSRLVGDKGHSYLIDAAQKVLQRFPDTKFVIVGWGPLEGTLRRQAATLGIEKSVTLPGRMDIMDVLPLADMYVDPAVSTDLPVAIMEAMREGKAIVATNIGEIPAFIKNGKTGIVVEPRNSIALTEAIERLLADPFERDRLGVEATEAVKELSMERYSRQFEELIRRLLSEKHTKTKV